MSARSDLNTRVVVRQAYDRVSDFLRFFDQEDASWFDFGPGKNQVYVESLKHDLALLSQVVDGHLHEEFYSQNVQDIGT